MNDVRQHLADKARTLLGRMGYTVARIVVSTRQLGAADLAASGAGWQDEYDKPTWHAWAELADGKHWLAWLAEGGAVALSPLRGPLTGDLFAPPPLEPPVS